jgi:crossover junction endodeoxyribonuclease RusA
MTGGSATRAEVAQARLEAGLPVSWTIPALGPWLTSNQRQHWRQKAQITKTWRHGVRVMARRDGLPVGLDRLHITCHIHQTHPRKTRDPLNLSPTIKALMDGLIDHGLLPDDDAGHLLGPDIRRGADGPPAITIHMIRPKEWGHRVKSSVPTHKDTHKE